MSEQGILAQKQKLQKPNDRAYYRVKSEREKLLYINAYIWNLERWH